jgi:hypothetical protein
MTLGYELPKQLPDSVFKEKNLNVKSIKKWKILKLNKEQAEQLLAILPKIIALEGKLVK